MGSAHRLLVQMRLVGSAHRCCCGDLLREAILIGSAGLVLGRGPSPASFRMLSAANRFGKSKQKDRGAEPSMLVIRPGHVPRARLFATT